MFGEEKLITRQSNLSSSKQMLLEKLRRGELGTQLEAKDSPDWQISCRQDARVAPLSYMQQKLWFIQQLDPDSTIYNITGAVRIKGALNIKALERSINGIVDRHEILRTAIVTNGQDPIQLIASHNAKPLPVLDIGSLGKEEDELRAKRLVLVEASTSFDLRQGNLFRAKLLKLSQQEHWLVLSFHHIVFDGWSQGVFFKELSELYKAHSNNNVPSLTPLPIQYGDYALWQRKWLQGETIERQLAYWKKRMDGAPPVLELPSDKVRPSVKGYGGAAYLFELGQELCEGLRALSQQIGVTMFMTLLAGFKTLLHRYTGQADIVVGTPISGRTRTEIEGLIGFFVNTLVLRTNLGSNPRFVDLLKQERDVVLDAYAHQEAPFERLVEELQPGRDLSRTPLFQVMFAFQNTPRQTVKMEGLSWEPVPIEHESAKFDLMLFVTDTGSKLKLSLQYSTDLFEEEAIRRMAGNLQLILKGIVSNPEQHIKELPLVTEAERRQLLTEWNDTQRSYDDSLLIHQLFESQVERRPEAVALVCGEDSLSYAELNRRANLLAHHLRRLGIGSETLVGVLMDRSTEMLVSLLAVLKSGGAYVPLDPQYPAERLAFMLEDTAVRVLLTQRRMVESLPEHQAKIVCVDTDWGEIADGDELNSDSLAQPDNLAYVIYTSGSTGKPKGVAITHRSCSIFLQWAAETFSAEDFKGALASTSICFDLSIFELFAPLCCGGSIVMAQNVLQLAQLGDGHPVRLINTVPSAMTELLRLEQVPESVQIVNLAGEALSRQLVEQIYSHPNVRQVWNLYGPSEDTTYSTAALVLRGGGRVTIGRPVSQTQAYVLDELLQCVPVGVAGELYLGGDGLARGYLNRSNSTAERFVPDPYSPEPGRRLYRTGDLARYLADGQLEHLGRVDYQVKIRGFRIELGEIESTLHNHPDVHEATVIAREIQVGEKQLVAYVAPKEGTELRVKQLRAYLQEKLPDYMIPNAFVFLKKMPLTPNGKIDRQALPTSGLNFGQEDDYVAPRGTAEKLLCDIWADVLCIDRVGINDNFFAIGGHSLRAIQVISRVRDAFEVDLPLRSVFEAATVSGLAVKIAQAIISQSD